MVLLLLDLNTHLETWAGSESLLNQDCGYNFVDINSVALLDMNIVIFEGGVCKSFGPLKVSLKQGRTNQIKMNHR